MNGVQPGDLDAFRRVVRARRAVRRFTETPIPEETIADCLDLAVLAPNSSNLQPWEFHCVRDAEKRHKLASACFGQKAAQTANVLIVVVARTRTWRKHCREIVAQWPGGDPPKIVRRYYAMLAPLLYTQGPFGILGYLKAALFWAIGWFRPVPRSPFGNAAMRSWAIKSAALAAENLMLALTAHGFDSCPMEGFDAHRVRRLLGLPRDANIVMIVAAGERAPNGIYQEQFRFPSTMWTKNH